MSYCNRLIKWWEGTLAKFEQETHLSCGLESMFVRADSLLLVCMWICNYQNQDIHTVVRTLRDVSVSCRFVAKLCFVVHSPVAAFRGWWRGN